MLLGGNLLVVPHHAFYGLSSAKSSTHINCFVGEYLTGFALNSMLFVAT